MNFKEGTIKLLVDLYATACKLNRKNSSLKRQYLRVALKNFEASQSMVDPLLHNFDVDINASFVTNDYVGKGLEIPVSESVRLVGLSQKLKKECNYIQKLVIVQLLLEQFKIGDVPSHLKNEALDVISMALNVRLSDFQVMKFFSYIDLSEKDFDENTVILSSTPLARQEAIQDKKHILLNGIKGYIVFKNVSGLILFKYQGLQSNYFVNGDILESGRTYIFSDSTQLMVENGMISYASITEQLYRKYRLDDLRMKATPKTPDVSLNKETGEFRLEGRLYPENPFAFFDTVNVWIDYYLSLNPKKLNVFLDIAYYNTTSSKLLLNLLKKIVSFESTNFDLSITWQYGQEDEEMKRTIANFATLLEFPITIIEEKDEIV